MVVIIALRAYLKDAASLVCHEKHMWEDKAKSLPRYEIPRSNQLRKDPHLNLYTYNVNLFSCLGLLLVCAHTTHFFGVVFLSVV